MPDDPRHNQPSQLESTGSGNPQQHGEQPQTSPPTGNFVASAPPLPLNLGNMATSQYQAPPPHPPSASSAPDTSGLSVTIVKGDTAGQTALQFASPTVNFKCIREDNLSDEIILVLDKSLGDSKAEWLLKKVLVRAT